MALHKEPYGLVYNDDGSLCVTLRRDDTPFEGVTSFAVEEGTENLVPGFFDGSLNGWRLNVYNEGSITLAEGEGLISPDALLYTAENTDNFRGVRSPSFALTGGQTYTLSAYLKGKGYVGLTFSTGPWQAVTWCQLTGSWQRCSVTYTPSDDETMWVEVGQKNVTEPSIVYIDGVQAEQKPFATSFVDGSRPAGRFYIPLESLGFDPANDDWVVTYWSKPFQLDTHKVGLIGLLTSDHSQGYMWWGLRADGYFGIWAILSDGSVAYSYKSANIDCKLWHFEVMVKNGNELKYYFDGEEKISLTLSQPLKPFVYGLSLGFHLFSGETFVHNVLLSNIYIGKAKVGDKLIWNDDYIKQLYQAKRPFSVPPKMPVV